MDLTNKAKNTIIQTALKKIHNLKLAWSDCRLIQNKTTQHKLQAISINNDGTVMSETNGQAAWDQFVDNRFKISPLLLEEIFFRLRKLIFGTNSLLLQENCQLLTVIEN